MNWYAIVKTAQLWAVEWDPEDFGAMLHSLYELEYKYSMAKTRPFSGVPQRRENIINRLEEEFVAVAEEVRDVLVRVFDTWLNHHALLSPHTWASSRLRKGSDYEYHQDTGEGIDDLFNSMLYDYAEHTGVVIGAPYGPGMNMDGFLRRTLDNDIMPNIEQYPALQSVLKEYLVGYKEMLKEDLSYEGFEEFGQRVGQEFANEEEAQNWIDNLGTDVLEITAYIDSVETLAAAAQHNWPEVLEEMYANLVFPVWYDRWYQQGIKETRATIARIWEQLNNVSGEDPEEMSAVINTALQATHQTGSMLDYVAQDTDTYLLKELLTSLSKSEFVPEWNKELAAAGFEMS